MLLLAAERPAAFLAFAATLPVRALLAGHGFQHAGTPATGRKAAEVVLRAAVRPAAPVTRRAVSIAPGLLVKATMPAGLGAVARTAAFLVARAAPPAGACDSAGLAPLPPRSLLCPRRSAGLRGSRWGPTAPCGSPTSSGIRSGGSALAAWSRATRAPASTDPTESPRGPTARCGSPTSPGIRSDGSPRAARSRTTPIRSSTGRWVLRRARRSDVVHELLR